MRDNQLRVRGILLLGVPGVGKSLASRVAGSLLSWPVLRCDISGLKGSLVGQSEGNMRAALKLAEAVSPCVLYLDEVEKAVGGYASSAQSDSGVTLGMVGTLLTWLQEHQSPILTIATCNDYSKLPAELTRAGRFDERFFVDLPCKTERIDIAAIHLHKFGCMGGWSEVIADLTEEWTGAEIEQLVKSVSRRTDRKPNIEVIAVVSKEIKPISRVRGNEINKLREWGRSQLRIANTVENDTRPARKVGRV
jgi:SpoVK/Ycf46/Vps4 family AAA+-type ATPase